jgi:TetR/AcrR family transcriptional regulator, fatty acid metabolism regulator protein
VATTDAQREKRRQILRAAIAVFARSGYHGSRVSDVAKEAGVAYGLVYHYFGSKEDLLEAVFRRTWSRMLQAVEEIERSGVPAREQLTAVARIVLGAWETDPDLVRVLVKEVTRSPQLGREVEEIEHAFEALERIVRAGQESGDLRADVDPRIAASILYGALEDVLTSWVFERMTPAPGSVEEVAATVVDVVVVGLASR